MIYEHYCRNILYGNILYINITQYVLNITYYFLIITLIIE